MKNYNLLTVTGPTASGKTSFAARMASVLGGEIISADSRQVYRKMTIGTGKDLDEYIVDKHSIPYHLIDIHDPGYKYNVYEFQQDFITAFEEISNRKKLPVLVGGTGMYVEAVLKGYELINVPRDEKLRKILENNPQEELIEHLKAINPALHNTTDTTHRNRTIRAIEIAHYQQDHREERMEWPKIETLILGIKYDRQTRRKRISERLKIRIKDGMIDEIRDLLKEVDAENLIFYGLEYKYLTLYVTGQLDYNEMLSKLEVAIHQFAKRQMTWFRRMERNGMKIHWIDGQLSIEQKIEQAFNLFKKLGIDLNHSSTSD